MDSVPVLDEASNGAMASSDRSGPPVLRRMNEACNSRLGAAQVTLLYARHGPLSLQHAVNELVDRCCQRDLELATKIQPQQIDGRNLQLDHGAWRQFGEARHFYHEWNVRHF